MQTTMKVEQYDEAVKAIREIGILPLSPLFPEYPSLESLTNKADWYTETDRDPWLWRARFPADGVAAYGKFFKKKSILIARELVPAVKSIIGQSASMQQRYADGLVSKTMLDLQALIEVNPGIETRALRKLSGLDATEHKKAYDQAITELQAGMDIVISGVKQRLNDNGDKNGWNSTSFESADHWLTANQIDTNPIDVNEAKRFVHDWLQPICNADALKMFNKLLGLT
ncbi:hypothetical protein [Cohnella yongneupensis]|uniref:Uncharacterized protein n=1 Tax=Cohnella yongneupensis TaxID=425006 RepID=A0ABW0QTE5_9BACL